MYNLVIKKPVLLELPSGRAIRGPISMRIPDRDVDYWRMTLRMKCILEGEYKLEKVK